MRKYTVKIIVTLFMLILVSTSATAFARPGGGGGSSGGGSGGGSGGRGGSSHTSSSNGRSNPISSLISLGTMVVIGSAGTIVYKVKVKKKKVESVGAIKGLQKSDSNWDYGSIKKDVQDAFDKIAIAWIERDQSLAIGYVSEKLYERHNMQLEWMKIRREKNILEELYLLDITPVGLTDNIGIDNDQLWVLIRASSIDYTINEDTNEVIKGNKYRSSSYQEYWKFIKTPERWVLDEIRQLEEIEDLEFFKVSIDKSK